MFHRVLPAEKKNELIYNGDVETAFNEIVKIFEIQGGAIKLIEYNRILIMILFPLKNKQKNNILIKILPNIIEMKFILIFPCKGIHPSPSNYEYLPSMHMSVTPCSLPINSHFREEQNSLNSHLPNGQEQQFATPSNNYTLSSNSFTNVNINQSSNGKTNGFEYYLL
ncbi:unnamed protein product [Rhizophagus irregularis]|nr:unnamed protein product [Rhizophagus irregularis]